jgi:hypothetical protein
VARSFLIHSVRVGVQEVTAAACPIPADAFITDLDKLASIEELFKRDKAYELKIDKSGAELLGMPLCLPTAQPGTIVGLPHDPGISRPKIFGRVLAEYFWDAPE